MYRNYIDLSEISSDASSFMSFPFEGREYILALPYSVERLPRISELYDMLSAAVDGGTMTEDELSREAAKRLSDLSITSRTEYLQCDGRLITEIPHSIGATITVSADPQELTQEIISYKLRYC